MKHLFLIMIYLFSYTLLADAVTKRPEDIVDIQSVDPSIHVDMMYFRDGNFTGRPVPGYKANICFLSRKAAEDLKLAQARLQEHGNKMTPPQKLSLFMRDCYRPAKAVKAFVTWAGDPKDIVKEKQQLFYPHINKPDLLKKQYISDKSQHSHGSTFDLTIVRNNALDKAEPLDMGTLVDFFGEASHTASQHVSAAQHANRMLLQTILGPEFKNYANEWWHYSLVQDPYPNTVFDFDVEPADGGRAPQSVMPDEILTELTQPSFLAQMDHDNRSPLALVNLFRIVHESNGLPVPGYLQNERSRASQLSLFTQTYGRFASKIHDDIAQIIAELGIDWEKDITKTYDPASAKTARGRELRKNGNVTRFFNEKWLTSNMGQFLLAGIVNRIDRREFTPGSCGEVRFVYRFAYETTMGGQTYASRTPLTLNMVFNYPDDGDNCRATALQWQLQAVAADDPARVLTGPLDFSKLKFKQMEVNLQIARFPSDLENQENRKFAGQAIYLMRIFNVKDKQFAAKKLENTPDVKAIQASPDLQKRLRDYIGKNLPAIDSGVYIMPDELLADVAITYSTLGSSRLANKPFDVLLKSDEAQALLDAGLKPEERRFAQNGPGLIERLNMSTCMGCHQSSSTAGFHFLGLDRTDFSLKPQELKAALDGNRLVLPFSPHLYAELPRRARYVTALAMGQAPNSFRPHPSAPPAAWNEGTQTYQGAGDNMPCPLDGDSSFARGAHWSCDKARGLTCQALVTDSSAGGGLGQCVVAKPKIYSGLSCRKSAIQDSNPQSGNFAFNIKSFNDHVTTDDQIYGLGEGSLDAVNFNCRPTRIGVPLGRVTKACTGAGTSLSGFSLDKCVPNEMCAVVGGKGFEEMAKGYFNSKKFAEGVGRGMLNTCSPTRFCREDYICQEMPDFLTGPRFKVSQKVIDQFRKANVGFCTPTYFVYQLRLDGHPNP